MILKSGVKVQGFHPELNLGLFIANEVYAVHGVNMVVTSGTEGKHSRTSSHYLGLAADLRVRNLPNTVSPYDIAREIQSRLGPDYDVIFEGEGTPNAHIHLQFRPKYEA